MLRADIVAKGVSLAFNGKTLAYFDAKEENPDLAEGLFKKYQLEKTAQESNNATDN